MNRNLEALKVMAERRAPAKLQRIKNAPGVKTVVEQLNRRFRDFQAKEHVDMERILGVGCDGDAI